MKCKSMKRLVSAILSLSIISVALVGCGDNKAVGKDEESKYTHRVILVSDMHYASEESAEELQAKYPDSNPSIASGQTFGYTQAEKIQAILDDIDDFAERQPIDAVMVLGDLSLDDYGYRNLPVSYLKEVKKEFLDELDFPWYAIAGNHDSYPNEEWKAIIGTDRQYSVKIGDAAFIMLDTFDDELATGASGSPYIGVDVEWLEEELKKYPTETIFLCSHYYQPKEADYKFKKILKDNPRIVCMFRGHTHKNTVLASEYMNYKILADIGGYAYDGDDSSGAWDFSQFNDNWAWGYQVLEWNDTEARIYHVKTPRTYTGSNGTFNFPGGIEDDNIIKLKKDE